MDFDLLFRCIMQKILPLPFQPANQQPCDAAALQQIDEETLGDGIA